MNRVGDMPLTCPSCGRKYKLFQQDGRFWEKHPLLGTWSWVARFSGGHDCPDVQLVMEQRGNV